MAAVRNRRVPPLNSALLLVRTTRRTGKPSSSTAAPNGSHCGSDNSVSITVTPSSSITAPALARPGPLGNCSHAYTPGTRGSSITHSTEDLEPRAHRFDRWVDAERHGERDAGLGRAQIRSADDADRRQRVSAARPSVDGSDRAGETTRG